MRERLIELLLDYTDNALNTSDDKHFTHSTTIGEVADHLLANGVIVPPAKVGDTVWFNTFKKNATVCVGIQPHKVDRIDTLLVCDTKQLIETKIYDWEIGERVFLTKEEAEKALEERKNK